MAGTAPVPSPPANHPSVVPFWNVSICPITAPDANWLSDRVAATIINGALSFIGSPWFTHSTTHAGTVNGLEHMLGTNLHRQTAKPARKETRAGVYRRIRANCPSSA